MAEFSQKHKGSCADIVVVVIGAECLEVDARANGEVPKSQVKRVPITLDSIGSSGIRVPPTFRSVDIGSTALSFENVEATKNQKRQETRNFGIRQTIHLGFHVIFREAFGTSSATKTTLGVV